MRWDAFHTLILRYISLKRESFHVLEVTVTKFHSYTQRPHGFLLRTCSEVNVQFCGLLAENPGTFLTSMCLSPLYKVGLVLGQAVSGWHKD